MKILVVSNLYPPHHQGGYELRCAQIVDYLQRQGHTVRVVTSDFEITTTGHAVRTRHEVNNGVSVSRFLRQHRLDPWQPDGRSYYIDVVRRQIADATRFGKILDEFRPDLVSWWNLEGVTKVLLRLTHERQVPSVHWIEDKWMIREFGADGEVDQPLWLNFWRVHWGPRITRPLVRLALRPLRARLSAKGIPVESFRIPPAHVCFISGFWRYMHESAGLDVSGSDVIYGGVARERFYVQRQPEDYARGPLRLLYAGYVDQPRGLHTIVEALGLVSPEQRQRMHLSVASGGPVVPDEYVSGVQKRIATLGLEGNVTFLGRVRHDEMPMVYAAHDALVFASTRNEGMPMVMMEAMAAGCAVPNTGSGGAIELSDRAGTPLFPKDHPFALSRLLAAMERDRGWVAKIALQGQQTVLRDFTIEQMLQRTCDVFTRVATKQRDSELQPVSA